MAKKGSRQSTLTQQPARTLTRLLRTLANSPRYDLFKSVPLLQFLGDKGGQVPSLLKNGCIADLVKLGQAEISTLHTLKPAQVKLLTAIVRPLVDEIPLSRQTKGSDKATTMIGSVEAEQRLHKAASAIKTSPLFPELQNKTLGDFWDSSWPRAPFEEAMTFKQFSELKMEMILKKKSFGPEKIMAVVNAANRALELSGKPKKSESEKETSKTKEHSKAPRKIALLPVHPRIGGWENTATHIPGYGITLLAFVERERSASEHKKNLAPAGRILAKLSSTVTADEFVIAALAQDHGLTLMQKMLSLRADIIEARRNACGQKLRVCIEEICPEVARFWEESLRESDEIPDRLLTDPYLDSSLDKELQRLILKIALTEFRNNNSAA